MPEKRSTWEDRRRGEHDGDDRDRGDDSSHRTQPFRQCATADRRREHKQRHKPTGQQLPGTGEGGEIRDIRIDPGEIDGIAERCNRRHRHGCERDAGFSEGQQEDRKCQERPHEIELLFDGQRPVMQHRTLGGTGGEVVDGLLGEHPVRHIERRRREGRAVGRDVDGRGNSGIGDSGDRQDEQGSRKEAACAPRPETHEVQSTGRPHFANDERSDEESGEDEEHVDAHETSRQKRHAGVEEHHEADSDRAQAIEAAVVVEGCPGGPFTITRGRRRRQRRLAAIVVISHVSSCCSTSAARLLRSGVPGFP